VLRTLSDRQKALAYSALVLLLGVCAALLINTLDLEPGFLLFAIWMSTPALATLAMLLVITRDGYSKAGWASLGVHRFGLNVWWIAFGVTLVLGVAVTSLVWATPLASFTTPKYGLLGTVIDFFFVLVVFTPTFILSEEIGMRGYLLPRLMELGTNRALLLVGLVWGLWHLPLFYLTSLFPTGNPLIFVPLVIATIVAASFLFGYFRIATESVWPGAVAHAVHNSLVDALGALTVTSSPVLVSLYLVGDNGILIVLSTALAALWIRHIFFSPNQPSNSAPSNSAW